MNKKTKQMNSSHINASPQPVEAILETIARYAEDNDPAGYAYAVSAGIEARKAMTHWRFVTGDLALAVETHYRERTIAEFADDIGKRPNTVYQYRLVSRFWQRAAHDQYFARAKYLNQYPMLDFSHFRAAMHAAQAAWDSFDVALAFLDACALNQWTIIQAETVIKERYGEPRAEALPVEPKPLIDHVKTRGEWLRYFERYLEPGLYRVVVYAISEPVELTMQTQEAVSA